MPKAEIITIGTELLLGEILDSNAQTIAKLLRDVGIDLYWITTIGDNRERIAQSIRDGFSRADILLCTGGLGPTVDDVSREGIADGIGLDLEFHEDLWLEIQERFRNFGREASVNNRRQAFVPEGATVLPNPNGSAPAFMVEKGDKVVVSMPGVPQEMLPIMRSSVLPYLSEHYQSSAIIKTRILHSAASGESLIDEKIADLEELTNPTVGLAAHMGAVDIRLTAKAEDESSAIQMLNELEAQVRERIGDWIYGVDGESQQDALLRELQHLGWKLGIFHLGFESSLKPLLNDAAIHFEAVDQATEFEALEAQAQNWQQAQPNRISVAASRSEEGNKSTFQFSINSPAGSSKYTFDYGGTMAAAPEWGSKLLAETLRRYLIKQ